MIVTVTCVQLAISITPTGCPPETVPTESGITYVWEQSVPGRTAQFMCPLNSIVATRRCVDMGWEPFDQQSCGTFSDVVDQFASLFDNVRYTIIVP